MSIDYSSEGTHHDSEPDYDELSDHSSEKSIDMPDHLVFEEDDSEEDDMPHPSLQDIVEQLEAWVAPNTDSDFYELRGHSFSCNWCLHN